MLLLRVLSTEMTLMLVGRRAAHRRARWRLNIFIVVRTQRPGCVAVSQSVQFVLVCRWDDEAQPFHGPTAVTDVLNAAAVNPNRCYRRFWHRSVAVLYSNCTTTITITGFFFKTVTFLFCFYARKQLLLSAHLSHRNSGRPSVCPNRNCYRLSRVPWALAQISCFLTLGKYNPAEVYSVE